MNDKDLEEILFDYRLNVSAGEQAQGGDGDLETIDRAKTQAIRQLTTLFNKQIVASRIDELNRLDDVLFPPPYKRINFNKLKDYKADRIKELEQL